VTPGRWTIQCIVCDEEGKDVASLSGDVSVQFADSSLESYNWYLRLSGQPYVMYTSSTIENMTLTENAFTVVLKYGGLSETWIYVGNYSVNWIIIGEHIFPRPVGNFSVFASAECECWAKNATCVAIKSYGGAVIVRLSPPETPQQTVQNQTSTNQTAPPHSQQQEWNVWDTLYWVAVGVGVIGLLVSLAIFILA